MTRRPSLALTLTLAACGADSGPDPAAPAPAAARATLGPHGGQLTSLDGRAVLDVPVGALEAPTDLAIAAVADELSPGELAYELSPHGLVFARPVRLAITRDVPAGTDSAGWTVAKLHEDGSIIAHPTAEDLATGTATAVLTSFSRYAMWPADSLPGALRISATHAPGVTVLDLSPGSPVRGDRIVVERAGPFLQPPRESDWRTLAELPIAATRYVDAGPFAPEAIYWYRARIATGTTFGAPATTFVGTFVDRAPRPLGLTARVRGTDVDLFWDLFAIPGLDELVLESFVDGARVRTETIPNTFDTITKRGRARGRTHRFQLYAVRDGTRVAFESIVVPIEGFAIALDAQAVEVPRGSSVDVRGRVSFLGPSSPVALSVRGAGHPIDGIHPTFSNNPTHGGELTLTLVLAATVAPGRHMVHVRAESADQAEVVPLTVNVTDAVTTFDVELTPNPLVIRSGGAAVPYAIEVRYLGGCYAVALGFPRLPSFLTPVGPVAAEGRLAVTAAPAGTYELVVEGECGGRRRARVVPVIVAP